MNLKLGSEFKPINIGSTLVEMKRIESGVVCVRGDNFIDVQKGLGFAHAMDRLSQLIITRLFTEGRLAQYLSDSDETFAFDFIIRKLGLQTHLSSDIENLSDGTKAWCAAYCEGVNTYVERYGLPSICRLLRIPYRPWTIPDIVIVIKMHMYLGLAQGQERTEKFIIQAIQDGVSAVHLRKLFAPHLDRLDDEIIQWIQRVRLELPYLNYQLRFQPGLSNNWAISGKRTKSGMPLCGNDPHVQINRLPAMWYEAALQVGEEFQMGITAPGVPGVIMGRSHNLYLSFTYGMMDTIDFFLEEIENGKVRREEGTQPLHIREEVIERKTHGPVVLKFFETQTGVIERKDGHKEIENGIYLSHAWSGSKVGVAMTLNSMASVWASDSALTAGKLVRQMALPCNWVLADTQGNIGYQQSGALPKRAESGLFPLVGWKHDNLWKGFVDPAQLYCSYNPECGFVASANDDKNQVGKPLAISAPHAPYRHERIVSVLKQDKQFIIDDIKQLQTDVYSLQAEKFLQQIKEFIPDSDVGAYLRNWDCQYTLESLGATLFEAFYFDLQQDVFGKVFGEKAWSQIVDSQTLLIFTHGHFDRILLSDDQSWFKSEGKKECLKRVLTKTLNRFAQGKIPPWGKQNQVTLANLLFDRRLPKFLGFDIGPLYMQGSRATVAACFTVHEKKRPISIGASYRMVTDLSTSEAFTVLAGGPSEQRLSKYYASDVHKWANQEYKVIACVPQHK